MAIEFKECQYEEFKYKARHKTIHQMGEFVLQKALSINDVFEHYLHYVNRVKKKTIKQPILLESCKYKSLKHLVVDRIVIGFKISICVSNKNGV